MEKGMFEVKQIASIFGVRQRSVIKWISRGWLKARKSPIPGGFRWVVTFPDLIDFIKNHYCTFNPTKIVKILPEGIISVKEPKLEERQSYLIKEISLILGIDRKTALNWIYRGWLKASKFPSPGGFKWIVALPDLREFIKNYYWTFDPKRVAEFLKPVLRSTPAEGAISIKEAARLLGISEYAVREKIAQGKFTAYRRISRKGHFQWYIIRRFKCLKCGEKMDSIPGSPGTCPVCKEVSVFMFTV